MITYGAPDKPAAEMEQMYQSWGLSPGKRVVIYDQGGSIMATRLFFALYYHGFPAKNLAVLDGAVLDDVPVPFVEVRADGAVLNEDAGIGAAAGESQAHEQAAWRLNGHAHAGSWI